MLLNRFVRDLSRLTRRRFHTRTPIVSSPPTPAIATANINQWLIRADRQLINNLNALNVSVNHIIPPSLIRPPGINNAVVDPRVNFLYDIENPLSHISNEIGEKPLQIIQDFELPTVTSVIGDDVKEAKQPGKTTILIRRRKMRKHKLRKFRKRMKFTIMKKRQRLLLRREKEFQARLIGQIKETEKFSAEAYVTEKLEKSKPLELEKSHIHV